MTCQRSQGWWAGADIDVRDEHGRLGEGVDVESVRAERAQDRPKLWDAFSREHVTEGTVPSPDETGSRCRCRRALRRQDRGSIVIDPP